MTFIAKDIADQLKTSTSIYDDVAPHIYLDTIPQGVDWEKAIVVSEVSAEPAYYLAGEAGTHTTVVQVQYWTDGTGGRTKANTGAELIRNRLSGYRGQFGTGVRGTSRLISTTPLLPPPIDGSDNRRRGVNLDFEIIHRAAAPDFT